MSVRNTGVPYYLSQDVGTTVGTGAQVALASPGHSTNLYDIIVNGDASRRSSYVSNGSAYNTTPVSLSVFFGHSGPGSGENQTPKSGPGYTKNNATYVATLTKLGSNSLNGGVLAGTNGDFESFFVGRDAAGNHYYAATFQSHAWRPGANLYRMRADGGQLQRVYSHHHLSDMVPVNSQSGGPMSNITSNVGSGWLFYSVRRDTDGSPRIMVTSWSAGNIYDGETVNSSIVGSNNVPQTFLSSVSAWGQVTDAINIPNSDDRYTTGATLYVRQWEGPRVVFAKRNGSNGILNQHMRNMASFDEGGGPYDNWIVDNNSGNTGGICFSPGTSRLYALYAYEERTANMGENLVLNVTDVGGFNGTGAITTNTPRLGLIHFIWGGNNDCRADWGSYTAAHICYLDTISGTDRLAYAFTKIRTSAAAGRGFYPGLANGLYFRISNATPTSTPMPSALTDRCSGFAELINTHVTTDVNYYQRIRVRKMGVQRVHNSSNVLTETWYWVALSWVDGSQRIRVRIWRVNFATSVVQQMHDFTGIDSFRGMAAFNGTHTTTAWEPQHLFVFGTNNEGLQSTETYSSGKAYNPGYEHDRSKSIRFV